MTSSKKNKVESTSKWSRRVLKRRRQKDEFTKKYTKIDVKRRTAMHHHQQHNEFNLIANTNRKNESINGGASCGRDYTGGGSGGCETIGVTQKSLLRKISTGFFSPVLYLLNFTVAKVNSVSNFITRPFQQRRHLLDDLEERVSQLEKEVNQLQQFKTSVSQMNINAVNTLQLNNLHRSSLPAPPPVPTMAPPPPPPPPPPPLPSIMLPTKIRVPRSVKKIENPKKETKTNNPQITAEILKTVTLRKVTSNPTVLKEIDGKENDRPCLGGALVSLSQLKNVKLKKSIPKKVTPRNSLSASKRKSMGKYSDSKKTPENMFKRRLRKSNVLRSPGGTPIIKPDLHLSTGEGLTPMLTNALKKKFYNVKPFVSPEIVSPTSSNESSPTTNLTFEEQSPSVLLSPLAV